MWEMFCLSFIASVFLTTIASVIAYTPCPKAKKTAPTTSSEEAKRSGYYASRISLEEFNKQRADYTMDQIRLLQRTPEYKSALELKGYDEQEWNWQ